MSIENVKTYIKKLTENKMVKGFRETLISKNVDASEEEIKKAIKELLNEGHLNIEFELCCSNCFTLLDKQSNKNNFKESYFCYYCENEIEDLETETYVNELYIRS